LSAIAFVLFLFTESIVDATLYLCLFAIGNSLIRPCVTSLITQISNVGHGVSTGLSSSFDSLGRIIGPLFASVLFGLSFFTEQMDGAWAFIAGSFFSLVAIGIVFLYIRATKVRV
jgi:MFS family permease